MVTFIYCPKQQYVSNTFTHIYNKIDLLIQSFMDICFFNSEPATQKSTLEGILDLLNVFICYSRHADVMKKIIQTVADGGGELGVHMYPLY